MFTLENICTGLKKTQQNDFGLWTSDFGLWTLDFGLWLWILVDIGMSRKIKSFQLLKK